MKSKGIISMLVIGFLITLLFVGCTYDNNKFQTKATESQQEAQTEEQPVSTEPSQNQGSIILSTTTSTQDSGLLDFILPKFTEETGIEVKVVAVGSGQALQMGKDGEADVLLVHAKASEEEFVGEGHAVARYDVMYNDFVVIGPKDDPAGLLETKGDIKSAFTEVSKGEYIFVSRGDDSGTDKKEKSIWKSIGIEPEGDWYLSTGKGMGDVIQMTNEKLGYTLSDRASFLSLQDKVDLKIVVEKDASLINQYGVIPVNPDKNSQINEQGANAFVTWILSEKAQKLIGEFGIEEYGQPLFTPNANK